MANFIVPNDPTIATPHGQLTLAWLRLLSNLAKLDTATTAGGTLNYTRAGATYTAAELTTALDQIKSLYNAYMAELG